MRSFNPVCKFCILFMLTLVLACKHDPILNFCAFVLFMILLVTSGVDIKLLGWLMISVIILAVCMFFTGYRFSALSSMPVSADIFNIGSTSIWNGLIHSSRTLVFAGAGFLFALTTDKIALMRSVQQQLHLPQTFAYGILAAWGIVPGMMHEYSRTKAAFRARGMRVMFVSPKLLIPLLVKSIRWSEELSIAMKSKGFSETAKRTSYEKIKVGKRDWAMSFAGLCIAVALMVWFPG